MRTCEERRVRLSALPPDTFDGILPGLAAKVHKVLGVANALAAMQSYGSTAPAEVARQIQLWSQRLAIESCPSVR